MHDKALSRTAREMPHGASGDLCRGEPITGTPYLVVRPMARGGMGEVYEVAHALLGRRAVLKVLHKGLAHRADLASRLCEEARLLASIRHGNLVDVLDLGVLE